MRKSDWVEEGRIVILSIRQLGTATTSQEKEEEVGDILAIVDPRTYNKVRKEDGVNPLLFLGAQEYTGDIKKMKTTIQEDDIFDRGEGDALSGNDDSSDSPEDETPEERKIRIRIRDQSRAASRATKAVAAAVTAPDGTFDIDAI
jgi:hypothetical protein